MPQITVRNLPQLQLLALQWHLYLLLLLMLGLLHSCFICGGHSLTQNHLKEGELGKLEHKLGYVVLWRIRPIFERV